VPISLDDTFAPPAAVREAAARALERRAAAPPSQRGMTAIGLTRARDLSGGRPVSVRTILRMANYFQRHEIDKQGATWESYGKGRQAWDGWGGDAGRAWAAPITRRYRAQAGRARGRV